ncbi:hypothetical protein SAMN04488592_0621 [Microbacterium azadirachtae]|nr:hypothetical protein SAMN04488594_0612 [Microbacterium azadirachtae]SEF60802.1 hypothetical protein SAMN04488592_0621 [Microbacterium azadirachtae]
MREHGFKWSQATVWSIEKGERPLRLSEAIQVTDLLDVEIYNLESEDYEAAIDSALVRMQAASDALDAAVDEYEAARSELRHVREGAILTHNHAFDPESAVYYFDNETPERRVRDRATRFDLVQEAERQASKIHWDAQGEVTRGVDQAEA